MHLGSGKSQAEESGKSQTSRQTSKSEQKSKSKQKRATRAKRARPGHRRGTDERAARREQDEARLYCSIVYYTTLYLESGEPGSLSLRFLSEGCRLVSHACDACAHFFSYRDRRSSPRFSTEHPAISALHLAYIHAIGCNDNRTMESECNYLRSTMNISIDHRLLLPYCITPRQRSIRISLCCFPHIYVGQCPSYADLTEATKSMIVATSTATTTTTTTTTTTATTATHCYDYHHDPVSWTPLRVPAQRGRRQEVLAPGVLKGMAAAFAAILMRNGLSHRHDRGL